MNKSLAQCLRLSALILSFVMANTHGAAAQRTPNDAAYPLKPIVLISWSAAGSPVDVMAREIARFAPKYLHQAMVVEDKPGADGANAMQFLLDAPSDGYTLLCNTRSMMATLNTDLKDKFKIDQFTFIATLETDPYAFLVQSDGPYKSMSDLLAAAKTTALAVGGYGADSAHAILARKFAAKAGAKINWVPFSGGAGALTALLGGHINAMLGNISEARSQVESGKLRVLAISSDKPLAAYSGAVTLASLGYPDLSVSHWRGVMSKAGTTPAVQDKLRAFFRAVAQDPEFQTFVKSSGLTPFFNDPAQFARLVRSDMESMQGAK